VRSHAKASSAGSTSSRSTASGSMRREAFVTRASSLGADGSGAPSSRRGRVAVVLAAAALALLVFVPLARASSVVNGLSSFSETASGSIVINETGNGAPKGTIYAGVSNSSTIRRLSPSGAFERSWGNRVVREPDGSLPEKLGICTVFFECEGGFGNPPDDPQHGVFISGPDAIAINQASGDVYATTSSDEVVEFDAEGHFIRAWGWDAIGAAINERQEVNVEGTGGTYTLSFDGSTTAPIPYNANAAAVQSALAALPTIGGAANIEVTGSGRFLVTFKGTLGAANQPEMTADASQLTGLGAEGEGRITILTHAFDNGAPAAPNDTGTGFEICEVAAGDAADGSDCKLGSAGASGGEMDRPEGLAIDSSGNVWVAERNNRRIQEFDEDGHFIAAYGYNVDALGGSGELEKCTSTAVGACQKGTAGSAPGQFSSSQGISDIAFDSTGNLYAIDAGNSRVQKFDPTLLASATTFGASLFSQYTSGAPEHVIATQGGTRLVFSLNNNITANPTEKQIVEVDPTDPSSAKDTDLVAAHISEVGGLAVNPAGQLYATVGPPSPTPIVVFGPAPVPLDATVNDPVAVTDTTATLSATVQPNGAWINGCKFEYSTDQSHWSEVSAEGVTAQATLTGTKQVISIHPSSAHFEIGQRVTSSDGGIPAGTTVTAIKRPTPSTIEAITLSQDATTSGPVTLSQPGCSTLNASGAAQGVTANLSGLTPNQRYYVRFQASRPLIANSTVLSSVRPFQTESPPPVVDAFGAVDVNDASARLAATINPRNSETGYVFQYGATPALGSSTPPTQIGGGTTPITVSQLVSGLAPNTTYYLRVVATNVTGTTTSPLETFRTRATPLVLPEGRKWEMVSPVDKNYTDVDNTIAKERVAVISLDGNAISFCTTALFGDPPGQQVGGCAPYVSRRAAAGWHTTNPFGAYCESSPDFGQGEGGVVYALPSPDLSHFVQQRGEAANCPVAPLSPNAPLNPGGWEYNIYRQDASDDPTEHTLLDPIGGKTVEPIAGSEDFSHVVYQSLENETAQPDSPPPSDIRKLYDWEEDGEGSCAQPEGCLTLVTKNTANEPFTTPSSIPGLGSYGSGAERPLGSAVSRDGNRIYFENPVAHRGGFELPGCAPGCSLYLREDRDTTRDVSASECTALCGNPQSQVTRFLSATPSGEDAFFTTCAKLTDGSAPEANCTEGPWLNVPFGSDPSEGLNGSKLYRWELDAPPGHHLVDLTADQEPADGVQPNFRGLIGESADGNTAYFATAGQIVAGEPTAEGDKLYRWRWNEGSPTVDYLGPFAPTKDPVGHYDVNWTQDRNHVTPDGRQLLIYTALRLTAADGDEDADAYVWDEEDGWRCVSCQAPGVPSGGDVDMHVARTFVGYIPIGPELQSSEIKYMMDDAGNVFFVTPDALVPQDVNGESSCPKEPFIVGLYYCDDLYEWHDGAVRLVSSGTGAEPVRLIGTTPSGRDVFFYSSQRLVGWDLDTNVDIYDARVGGGFPEPPPAPPSCEGESCRGAGTSPSSSAGAGTAVFAGPGNPTPKQAAPKHHKGRKHHKKTRKHHRAKHRGRAANHNRRTGR
jgi:NHL repeat-containing protein